MLGKMQKHFSVAKKREEELHGTPSIFFLQSRLSPIRIAPTYLGIQMMDMQQAMQTVYQYTKKKKVIETPISTILEVH